ncbi:MAG: folate family ECF transporter S component [Acholeplasmataceae bacterium]|nr:folate family ECF transporter S component [Acholeplasmataceae bacterium]
MKQNIYVQKMVLAASLAAISIIIDVFFKLVLNIQNFGLPFYAIPIIFGSIILGPSYGIMIALVGDVIGVITANQTFLPFFVLGPIMWGLIPGLILHKKYVISRLVWVIPLTYLCASLSNTLALMIHFDIQTTLSLLLIRMSLIPFNSVIMFFLIKDIHFKLNPFFERFEFKPQEASQ